MTHTLRLFTFAIAVCAVFVQCNKAGKMASGTTKSSPAKLMAPRVPLTIASDAGYTWNERSDAYTLEKARISGDTLWMDITHGGGCEEHTFSAHTNGLIMKSLPPKMMIWMEHNAHGDACRALITTSIPIDLRPIRVSGLREVIVIPNGQTEQSVSYRY